MRKNKNAGGRRHDTRLTFRELCRKSGINVHERIIINRVLNRIRNMKNNINTKNEESEVSI